jgi:hypothetical protein
VARGFDSKSVTDQQEEKERAEYRDLRPREEPVSARRKSLQLARIDFVRRIEAAPEERREPLRIALAELDELIERS